MNSEKGRSSALCSQLLMVQWTCGLSERENVLQHPRPKYFLKNPRKCKNNLEKCCMCYSCFKKKTNFWPENDSLLICPGLIYVLSAKRSNAWKVLEKSSEGKLVGDELLAWSRKPVRICLSHTSFWVFFRKRYTSVSFLWFLFCFFLTQESLSLLSCLLCLSKAFM